MTSSTTRPARLEDLDAVSAIADERRRAYESFQPTFWRPARDALATHRRYLAKLIGADDVITLVSEREGSVSGFVIGRLTPAPPVYDPGGPTLFIDDFAVAEPEHWETDGHVLLGAVSDLARTRGAAQIVAVCGHLDEPKRAMLRQAGLSIASECWVARDLDVSPRQP